MYKSVTNILAHPTLIDEASDKVRMSRRDALKTTLCSLIFFFVSDTAASHEALPPAPSNFSWVKIEEMKVVFLRPDGWHFTNNKAKLLGSFAIYRKEPDTDGRFETGLTLYAIRNMGKTDRELPSRQIHRFVEDMKAQEGVQVFSVARVERGPFQGLAIRYVYTSSTASPIMYHRLFLANDRTDTILFITFESPESKWEETWRIGKTLVTTFILKE